MPERKLKFVTEARSAALLCLLDVEVGRFPEEALDDHGRGLSQRDRALAAALVYGVLRHKSRLEWILIHFLRRPDKPLNKAVQLILDLGLFQVLELDRVPVSAAVNESVNLAKEFGPARSAGFVNGVLRAVSRAESLPDPVSADLPPAERLGLTYSHPVWLVRRWMEELGLEETEALLRADNLIPPLTLRVNTVRASREEVAALMHGRAGRIEPTVYSPHGLLLFGQTGPVAQLPGYDEGLFAVQDEAAQVVGLLARPGPGRMVLDACAGRGGKALLLASLSDRPVWGLEPDEGRLAKAGNEAARLGLASLQLVRGDLLAGPPLKPESFDVVLVDAPCSNLGVIRRRPDVKWLKSAPDPARMARTQTRLLEAAARMVKPSGRLVYSVCTMTPQETIGAVESFQREAPGFALEPAAKLLPESARPLIGPDGLLRTWPHKHNTDAFFAAVFGRKG